MERAARVRSQGNQGLPLSGGEKKKEIARRCRKLARNRPKMVSDIAPDWPFMTYDWIEPLAKF
jgi:hypothetical protein